MRRLAFSHGHPSRRWPHGRGHRWFLGARLEPEWDTEEKSYDHYRWQVDTARVVRGRWLFGVEGWPLPFSERPGGSRSFRGVNYRYYRRQLTVVTPWRFVTIIRTRWERSTY